MSRSFRVLYAALSLAVVMLSVACAPHNTNSTYGANDIGRSGTVSYGVIVSMRPVTVQSPQTGVGTIGGAVAGGAAGSLIGRNNVTANIIGAVGGAILGGVAGSAIEGSASRGQAMEFIIREDSAPQPITVVQTNEEGFRPGERIAILRTDRTRIARTGG